MATFYIVPRGDQLDMSNHPDFSFIRSAQQYADRMHEKTGKHFHIIKVEHVWSTTTLADLMAEEVR